MTLKIILPTNIDAKTETHLIAALQDCHAEHVAGHEWRHSQGVIYPPEFREELRNTLREDRKEDADLLEITVFHPH
jgi:hypothetical protein